ncbi:propanediol utilization microcompartment protein PduB [Afifella aestuarii]|uniref:propanediol utilization microcompartment protein PduB n=1 Tax=Afifella aestuarii TaxID=1909496 RepID=UPI000FE36A61|nr:propanediol utilization microcompartment protein PduB [Afifella aestuarii]
MDDKLLDQMVQQVMQKIGGNAGAAPAAPAASQPATKHPGLTEFVGTAVGDSIGIVIANLDPKLHEMLGYDPKYRSIGILSSRTGAGPHILAVDEAVKATNTEVISIELARDTKGGAGHGSLIILGAEEVSDARRGIEVALKDLQRTFGDVYGNDAGHIELQYTARASYACNKAFGAPIGRAFGLCVGAPAGIGVEMVDAAVKSADVDLLGISSPAKGTSFSNEVIGFFSGDAGAVRQAVVTAREIGVKLLGTLGSEPKTDGTPYI